MESREFAKHFSVNELLVTVEVTADLEPVRVFSGPGAVELYTVAELGHPGIFISEGDNTIRVHISVPEGQSPDETEHNMNHGVTVAAEKLQESLGKRPTATFEAVPGSELNRIPLLVALLLRTEPTFALPTEFV